MSTEKDDTLSEKIEENRDFKGGHLNYKFIDKKDVKQHIQNAQKRLKEEIDMPVTANEIIDKIFKEEFGELICQK